MLDAPLRTDGERADSPLVALTVPTSEDAAARLLNSLSTSPATHEGKDQQII
jgi:hypothetical protein